MVFGVHTIRAQGFTFGIGVRTNLGGDEKNIDLYFYFIFLGPPQAENLLKSGLQCKVSLVKMTFGEHEFVLCVEHEFVLCVVNVPIT